MELIRKCIAYVLPTIGFFFLSSPRLAFLWQVQLQVCVVLAQRSCLHLTKRSWKGEEHNRPWLGSTCCRGKLIFPSFVCWKSKALRCVCVCVCVLGHWVWVCLEWKGCGRPQGLLVVQPQSHHFHMKLIGTLHSFPVRCVCGHLLRSCLLSHSVCEHEMIVLIVYMKILFIYFSYIFIEFVIGLWLCHVPGSEDTLISLLGITKVVYLSNANCVKFVVVWWLPQRNVFTNIKTCAAIVMWNILKCFNTILLAFKPTAKRSLTSCLFSAMMSQHNQRI